YRARRVGVSAHTTRLRNTQYATRGTQHAVRNTRYATRGTQHAVRNTRYATRGTQHAVRNTRYALRHRHLVVEVDVLDGVEEFDALGHRALERLAAGDQPHPARALVDDGRARGLPEVVGAGAAAGVDEAHPAHVPVGHLVARQVDGVVARQLGVDALVELAVGRVAAVEGAVAVVGLRLLLLEDVRLDGGTEVVGLAGEVGARLVVRAVHLEPAVAEVAPEDRRHAELVGAGEGVGDLLELARGRLAAEVDRRADGHAAHVERLLDPREHHLVVLVGVGEELVVVDLEDERDLVRVLPRDGPQHAVRRRD